MRLERSVTFLSFLDVPTVLLYCYFIDSPFSYIVEKIIFSLILIT